MRSLVLWMIAMKALAAVVTMVKVCRTDPVAGSVQASHNPAMEKIGLSTPWMNQGILRLPTACHSKNPVEGTRQRWCRAGCANEGFTSTVSARALQVRRRISLASAGPFIQEGTSPQRNRRKVAGVVLVMTGQAGWANAAAW